MRSKIALFGGSFNPPGLHHRAVVETLIPHFDKIIVIPCGPRPDKATTNDVEPWHRATMADIAFRDIAKVEVDLFDLEQGVFTPNDAFEQRYRKHGELWHVIGSDLSKGGGIGQSAIHQYWDNGDYMWNNLQFCVTTRAGYPTVKEDCPPKSRLLEIKSEDSGASSDIRELIFKRKPYSHTVSPDVADYIERYGLYRGRIPSRCTRWQTGPPRLLIFADERNASAMKLAEAYRQYEDVTNPKAILVLGGDGTMLRAIREHWRKRIPFIGLNQGHLGFLLNDASTINAESLESTEFVIRLMPKLLIEVVKTDGTRETGLAFNDAWIERTDSQTAWLEVTVNGKVRIEKLVADGALVCTAAGSTAYARSMGVPPLLADTPGWMLVGSNVMNPVGWKSALLSMESSIKLRSIGGEKRPLRAYVGGQPLGSVTEFSARPSQIATVELVFTANRDMAEKISLIQFPQEVS